MRVDHRRAKPPARGQAMGGSADVHRKRPAPKPPPEARARRAFEEGGAVLVAVGQRLAGRRDLLPPGLCHHLASADPSRGSVLATRPPPCGLLPTGWAVEPTPERVHATSQVHRAHDAEGRAFYVEVPRTAGLEALADPGLVKTMVAALREAGLPRHGLDVSELVRQSVLEARAELEPTARAGALVAMATVTDTVPPLEPALAREGVLAWPADGTTLDAWWRASPTPAESAGMARLLAEAWLEQALQGPAVPVAPSRHDVVLDTAGHPLLVSGAAAEADPVAQRSLAAYLQAWVEERAEDAADAWLHLLGPVAGPTGNPAAGSDPEGVRRRLLMASPRFGYPDPLREGRLAEQACAHWRLTRDAGFVPRPAAESMLSGLARLDALLGRLAPGEDALAWAVERRAAKEDQERWSTFFEPRSWRRGLAPIDLLTHRLESVLARLADGELKVQVELPPARAHRNGRIPAWTGAALLVACGLQLPHPGLAAAALLAAGLLLGSRKHAG